MGEGVTLGCGGPTRLHYTLGSGGEGLHVRNDLAVSSVSVCWGCFIAHYGGDGDMKMNGNMGGGGVTCVCVCVFMCHKNIHTGVQCKMSLVKGTLLFKIKLFHDC